MFLIIACSFFICTPLCWNEAKHVSMRHVNMSHINGYEGTEGVFFLPSPNVENFTIKSSMEARHINTCLQFFEIVSKKKCSKCRTGDLNYFVVLVGCFRTACMKSKNTYRTCSFE